MVSFTSKSVCIFQFVMLPISFYLGTPAITVHQQQDRQRAGLKRKARLCPTALSKCLQNPSQAADITSERGRNQSKARWCKGKSTHFYGFQWGLDQALEEQGWHKNNMTSARFTNMLWCFARLSDAKQMGSTDNPGPLQSLTPSLGLVFIRRFIHDINTFISSVLLHEHFRWKITTF